MNKTASTAPPKALREAAEIVGHLFDFPAERLTLAALNHNTTGHRLPDPPMAVRVLRDVYYEHGPRTRRHRAEDLGFEQAKLGSFRNTLRRQLLRDAELANKHALAVAGFLSYMESWVPEVTAAPPVERVVRERGGWDIHAAAAAMGCNAKAAGMALQAALRKLCKALRVFPEAETVEGRKELAEGLLRAMEQRALAAALINIADASGAPLEDVVRAFRQVRKTQNADALNRNREAAESAGPDRPVRDWEGLRCPLDSGGPDPEGG